MNTCLNITTPLNKILNVALLFEHDYYVKSKNCTLKNHIKTEQKRKK